jgi:hypothetical protein
MPRTWGTLDWRDIGVSKKLSGRAS